MVCRKQGWRRGSAQAELPGRLLGQGVRLETQGQGLQRKSQPRGAAGRCSNVPDACGMCEQTPKRRTQEKGRTTAGSRGADTGLTQALQTPCSLLHEQHLIESSRENSQVSLCGAVIQILNLSLRGTKSHTVGKWWSLNVSPGTMFLHKPCHLGNSMGAGSREGGGRQEAWTRGRSEGSDGPWREGLPSAPRHSNPKRSCKSSLQTIFQIPDSLSLYCDEYTSSASCLGGNSGSTTLILGKLIHLWEPQVPHM